MPAYFVTGTDTGIGKTYVSAVLAQEGARMGQKVIYYKPVQTGVTTGEPPEDPAFVSTYNQDYEWLVEVKNRYCFEPAVTPSIADPDETIDFAQIANDALDYQAQSNLLLVEGAGGLMAPLSKTTRIIDLIIQLKLPVILVAHARLGTMNHTLLSLEALKQLSITVDRLIINAYPQDLSQAGIAERTLLEGLLPHLPGELAVWTCTQDSGLLTEVRTPSRCA